MQEICKNNGHAAVSWLWWYCIVNSMVLHIYTDIHTDSIFYLQVWKIIELLAEYSITFDI